MPPECVHNAAHFKCGEMGQGQSMSFRVWQHLLLLVSFSYTAPNRQNSYELTFTVNKSNVWTTCIHPQVKIVPRKAQFLLCIIKELFMEM